jgi:[ribosomal protein S5]-alanine N-acetyltransferase
MIFIPFPTLETKRLLLRENLDSDAAALSALRSHPVVNRYIQRVKPAISAEEAADWIRNRREDRLNGKSVDWMFTVKGEPGIAGKICLWNFSDDRLTCEVGYEMLPEYFGKGIMSEALERVISYGFDELNVHHIEAFTHRDNKKSTDLLSRFGFIPDDSRRDPDVLHNRIFILSRKAPA